MQTKTTRKDQAPKLPLKGRAARAVVHWLEVTGIAEGPLFRPVSKADRPLPRRLAPDALRTILRHRLRLAGLPEDYATPHGLRAGFLTQAALDGAPLAAAMKLSCTGRPCRPRNTMPMSRLPKTRQPICWETDLGRADKPLKLLQQRVDQGGVDAMALDADEPVLAVVPRSQPHAGR